jgi:hypothetical protein
MYVIVIALALGARSGGDGLGQGTVKDSDVF